MNTETIDTNTEQGCHVMTPMERAIRRLAGFFVILSLTLGYFHSPYWYLFTLFVGLNLFQSSFTSFCPAEQILLKLGMVKTETSKQSAVQSD